MIGERTTQLLRQAQQGDRNACDTLLCGQQERLYTLCLRWTRNNTADAEDLAQETLVRACARLSQLQNVEALPAWLTQIAVNTCRNWLTRNKHDHLSFDLASPDAISATETAEQTLERLAIQEALGSLPPELRLAIRLFYLHGMTQNELAALWHLPASTIKGRLDSGRQRMRKELERMGMHATTMPPETAEISLPKTRIMLTDADPAKTRALRAALRSDDFTLSVISSEEMLLQRLRRQAPDILIMSTPFGNLDENDALRALRLDPRLRDIAVMFLVPKERVTEARMLQAWELGVDCFLTDTTSGAEICGFVRRMDSGRRAADYRTLAVEYAWRRDSASALLCLNRALQFGGKEVLEAVRNDPAFNYLCASEAFQALFA